MTIGVLRVFDLTKRLRNASGHTDVIVHIVSSNAGTLPLREKCSGTKLENTSLSAGIFQEPAYGRYNMRNLVPAEDSFAIAC